MLETAGWRLFFNNLITNLHRNRGILKLHLRGRMDVKGEGKIGEK